MKAREVGTGVVTKILCYNVIRKTKKHLVYLQEYLQHTYGTYHRVRLLCCYENEFFESR
jgi:hypothetical protein